MLLGLWREKPLRMVWWVERDHRRSYLIGTAHFFPYSFRRSLRHILSQVEAVCFEGPLDPKSMDKVWRSGFYGGNGPHLFEFLDRSTVQQIVNALRPLHRVTLPWAMPRGSLFDFQTHVQEMVKGMKPWMAFFTIWTYYLEKRGWTYSVDLEAHKIAGELGKEIVYLEAIEEQIEVLETLSLEKIVGFMNRVGKWDQYTAHYVKCYLRGELVGLGSLVTGFPSRSPAVIERRDTVLYERMKRHEQGKRIAVCLGAPHMPGILAMLAEDHYTIGQDRA